MTVSATLHLIRTEAPLYRDVAMALERAISEGVWKPGDQIPTESELETHLGISRGTLRAAISELTRKGWLHRHAGRGTFVLGPSFESLERFFRYERLSGNARIAPQNRVLGQDMTVADARIADALGIAAGSPVACGRRLRHHQDEPFLVIDSYFSPDTCQVIEKAHCARNPLQDEFNDDIHLYVISAEIGRAHV